MKTDFLQDENNERNNNYKKDEYNENYLDNLNNYLKDYDFNNSSFTTDYPSVFLVGLPRSGTTLAMQILTESLDLGFINNLTARFWKNPVVGIKLSKILEEKKEQSSFSSNYGKTKSLFEPHEFFYFWDNILNVSNNYYDHKKRDLTFDSHKFKSEVMKLSKAFQKPTIYKGIYQGFHAKKISEVLPNTYFIYIKRKPLNVAKSLFQARIDYYNDANKWWGTHIKEYPKLKNECVEKQLATQVIRLEEEYLAQLDGLDNKIIIDYEKLCQSPNKIISSIRNDILKKTGYQIDIKNTIDKTFNPSSKEVDKEVELKLIKYLKLVKKEVS